MGIWVAATVESRNGKCLGSDKTGKKGLIFIVAPQLRIADDTGFVKKNDIKVILRIVIIIIMII